MVWFFAIVSLVNFLGHPYFQVLALVITAAEAPGSGEMHRGILSCPKYRRVTYRKTWSDLAAGDL